MQKRLYPFQKNKPTYRFFIVTYQNNIASNLNEKRQTKMTSNEIAVMKTKKHITFLKLLWRNNEFFVWILALIMLYRADLNEDFTLCIPSNLGWKNCPGCGLGHSITALLHGNFTTSWGYHFFGVVALLILLRHILKLGIKFINELKTIL